MNTACGVPSGDSLNGLVQAPTRILITVGARTAFLSVGEVVDRAVDDGRHDDVDDDPLPDRALAIAA